MSRIVTTDIQVNFGDCDPAGIVYFPRFFDFFHDAMETWFSAHLGVAYAQVVTGRKIGFPAVHSEADFKVPCAFGESIAVELRVAKLGRSSIGLDYLVRGADGGLRLTGATTSVVMDLDPASPGFRRAIAVPDDLRARIAAFMAGASDDPAVPKDS